MTSTKTSGHIESIGNAEDCPNIAVRYLVDLLHKYNEEDDFIKRKFDIRF